MWGYAEGNEAALTVVVAAIIGAALVYVLRRVLKDKRGKR
jgi:hypothetical protein